MDSTDWRITLQPETRQRIINKIMETLKRHLPDSSPEGLANLRDIATRFEEKTYTAATNQSDYLRRISMKMMTMDTQSQTTGMANTIQSNSVGSAQNPPDSGQSQIPLFNQSETWHQMFSNVQNTIANTRVQSSAIANTWVRSSATANTRVQSSANLPSALSSVNSLTTNMQSGIEPNSVRNSVSQDLPSNIFSNSQYLYQPHQMLSYSTTQTGQDALDWRWRSTLQPDSRQKQLNRILETLKNCFPICGSVGLVELNKIAGLFEEEIYTAATSHSDYLHKIYLKILKMETRFQPAVCNQGQSQVPLLNLSRTRQQLLSQNTIMNAGVQSSVSLTEIRSNR